MGRRRKHQLLLVNNSNSSNHHLWIADSVAFDRIRYLTIYHFSILIFDLNLCIIPSYTHRGVYDGSKMKNFKQFTTSSVSWPAAIRCLWWFKDEEFQAIHNSVLLCESSDGGVYDGSKMKNFKQFTTREIESISTRPVSMMVQRWRISSNSQPTATMSR